MDIEGEILMRKIVSSISIIGLFVLGGCSTTTQNNQTSISDSSTENSHSSFEENAESNMLSDDTSNGNVAIVYYSLTGTTEDVANEIQAQTNGDLYSIETVEEYPNVYSEVADVVSQQREDGELPELQPMDIDLEKYDTIFIGSPIWFGSSSLPVQQWLSENELHGKTIYPFFTSGSSGIGTASSEIGQLAKNSLVSEGIGLTDNDMNQANELIATWLEES